MTNEARRIDNIFHFLCRDMLIFFYFFLSLFRSSSLSFHFDTIKIPKFSTLFFSSSRRSFDFVFRFTNHYGWITFD